VISPADLILLGGVALLLFGPERLPRVMRRAGNAMRQVQNTSSEFIREMERAADVYEERKRAEEFAAATTPAAETPAVEMPAVETPAAEAQRPDNGAAHTEHAPAEASAPEGELSPQAPGKS